MHVKGRPEFVTVDDLFPTYGNKVAFAKPTQDGGWWVPLLEKAYAKVNVNYESVSSGSHAEAARFLTGAPTREFMTNPMTVEEIWRLLDENKELGYIITAANFIDNNGLKPGTGYIVRKSLITSLASGEGKVRLLKMKSPWRDSESNKNSWTGRFSPKDKKSM